MNVAPVAYAINVLRSSIDDCHKNACTINIKMSVNDAFRIVINYSRVTLQIVASLTDNSRGVIYARNMFTVIVQASGVLKSQKRCDAQNKL